VRERDPLGGQSRRELQDAVQSFVEGEHVGAILAQPQISVPHPPHWLFVVECGLEAIRLTSVTINALLTSFAARWHAGCSGTEEEA